MTDLNDGTMRTLTDGEQERVSGASAEMVTTLAAVSYTHLTLPTKRIV